MIAAPSLVPEDFSRATINHGNMGRGTERCGQRSGRDTFDAEHPSRSLNTLRGLKSGMQRRGLFKNCCQLRRKPIAQQASQHCMHFGIVCNCQGTESLTHLRVRSPVGRKGRINPPPTTGVFGSNIAHEIHGRNDRPNLNAHHGIAERAGEWTTWSGQR
jgi:hypothetical protein